MSDTRLGRDVFVALAAIGWADGKLEADEADAIVRAAVDEGLSLEEIADIETVTKSPVDLGVIDRGAMTKDDRLFVYGVAAWIARMDGTITDEESTALASLGDRLGVPERPRSLVEQIAREVATMPDGDRPARYDLSALRRIIGERLKQSQAARGGASL